MITGRYISVEHMQELRNNESPSSVNSLPLAVLLQRLGEGRWMWGWSEGALSSPQSLRPFQWDCSGLKSEHNLGLCWQKCSTLCRKGRCTLEGQADLREISEHLTTINYSEMNAQVFWGLIENTDLWKYLLGTLSSRNVKSIVGYCYFKKHSSWDKYFNVPHPHL